MGILRKSALVAGFAVVFGCSLDPQGYMYALDGATGAVLWEFASGGSCTSGAAISEGMVFWGSGYTNSNFGTPNNKLYAFGLPQKALRGDAAVKRGRHSARIVKRGRPTAHS